MKIYTSCFGRLRSIIGAGLVPVGIAIYSPRWYRGDSYKKLAPDAATLKIGKSGDTLGYTERFNAMMAQLDPEQVVKDLESFHVDGSEGIVLCCYEKPGDFCHRHIVSQWLNDHLGHREVREFNPDNFGRKLTSLNNLTDD